MVSVFPRENSNILATLGLVVGFIVMLILAPLLGKGRNVALKAGLIGGGLFGLVIVGLVCMCCHLGYCSPEPPPKQPPSAGQPHPQHGQGGGERKEEHGAQIWRWVGGRSSSTRCRA